MQKTGKIEKLSIGDIRNTTKDNCTKLIDAIGAVVAKTEHSHPLSAVQSTHF